MEPQQIASSLADDYDDEDYYLYYHDPDTDHDTFSQRQSTLSTALARETSPARGASATTSTTTAAVAVIPAHRTRLSTQQHRLQQHTSSSSLTPISVPSFSAFRKAVPSAVHLPDAAFHAPSQHHSPRAASVSLAEQGSPRLAEPVLRPQSLDSPLLSHQPAGGFASGPVPHLHAEVAHPRDSNIHDCSSCTPPPTATATASHDRNDSIDSRIASTALSSAYSSPRDSGPPVYVKHAHEHIHSTDYLDLHAAHRPTSSSVDSSEHFEPSDIDDQSSMLAVQQAPTMTVQYEGKQRRLSDESEDAGSVGSAKRPKSPAGRALGSFFGFGKSSGRASEDDSPTTTFSDRSLSPLPSPRLVKTLPVEMDGQRASARLTPPSLDVHKANSGGTYFDNPQTPLLIGPDANNQHVRELERELSHISQELAGSIRREMELEDELDRIRMELPILPQTELSQRRGSDYFSDSGAGSIRFPITDVDAKLEQMDKQVRKAEQEKANLKVEMANRLQTELSRRRDLEELVQNLEDQLDKQTQQDEVRGNAEERLEELESTLDETRKRLGQERDTKQSFEDLYSATREELERHRNDAENLRNEVVPGLKARLEGLEGAAADTQALVYENTRLQQELAALKDGGNHSRFNSIAEEGVASAINPARMSLQRSGSLVRSSSLRRGGSIKERDGGRARAGSGSLAYPDGLKEIEDQRDALHKALKLLIKRHERQQRDHERATKQLTNAKDKAEQITPKRSAYTKEVAFLKEEVSTLRKRTEDALEQKWQYEKNLSGLKMDLDRAEQETRGLRIILQEHDLSSVSERSFLDGAEEDDQLKLSISRAENERDHARQVAEEYRQRANEASGESSEGLIKSAKRMEELAEELEKQAQANSELRDRLSTAVSRGEREQKESTRQIEEMQRRLAGMEDSVLAAQQHSETTLANHDAEVRRIEDASSPHLQRLRISIPEPSKLGPASPLLKKSPKLGSKKLSETSLLEMSRTQMLERKVKELEGLLREAEEDVQVVVQRVNSSQMEVAELQTERDAALTQMRKLQALVSEERERAEALMP
ncbi:hypothetical protein DOTSEDRAFT_68690 [Dothistroma septosporum NZE10]|uniref:DUF7603 domain-containing protein n=1 Tax=Dothistroma septosporum (strain NZE10 / CBS 128990) TaxID=675120 RepID=N1Q4W6_DOTSN|nr:hypothetical protein DOTSEDRAFT_68690 [Dothistroma septosporum NZE10]